MRLYKEIGGCTDYLTRCVHIAASIALNDESWINHSWGRNIAALAAKHILQRLLFLMTWKERWISKKVLQTILMIFLVYFQQLATWLLVYWLQCALTCNTLTLNFQHNLIYTSILPTLQYNLLCTSLLWTLQYNFCSLLINVMMSIEDLRFTCFLIYPNTISQNIPPKTVLHLISNIVT